MSVSSPDWLANGVTLCDHMYSISSGYVVNMTANVAGTNYTEAYTTIEQSGSKYVIDVSPGSGFSISGGISENLCLGSSDCATSID